MNRKQQAFVMETWHRSTYTSNRNIAVLPYFLQPIHTSSKAFFSRRQTTTCTFQKQQNSPWFSTSGPHSNCATQDIFKKDEVQQSIRSYWLAVHATTTTFSTNGKCLCSGSLIKIFSEYFKGFLQQLPPSPITKELSLMHYSWINKSIKEAGHTS